MLDEFCGSLPPPELCISQEAWQAAPWLVCSWVVSSAAIALAYGLIPLLLWRHFRGSKLAAILPWIAPFVLVCGIGHAVDIFTIWRPRYYWLTGSKAVTATISLASVWGLWKYLPVVSTDRLDRAMTPLSPQEQEEALEANLAVLTAITNGSGQNGSDL